jgi:hypothetical protein
LSEHLVTAREALEPLYVKLELKVESTVLTTAVWLSGLRTKLPGRS